MVPNTLHFLPAVNAVTSLDLVLPKPKSVERDEYKRIKKEFKTSPLSRDWAKDPNNFLKLAANRGLTGKKVVIVDIGGYFAESANEIKRRFKGELLGILEGTENGAQKYEAALPLQLPIVTVARSPLKLPEDYLVGSSVVFSIESTLRAQAEILQTRTATVLGYGRVGSSIAEILRGRGINTSVYDNSPTKLAAAAARGFKAHTRIEDALSKATLVVCATGNRALDVRGFALLPSGCLVASVTSADDELDLSSLAKGYDRVEISARITRYEENRGTGKHFLLVADGNAANFLDGAVIGPAIQLIEGEKLAAVSALANGLIAPATDAISELDGAQRDRVAEVWNEHFL